MLRVSSLSEPSTVNVGATYDPADPSSAVPSFICPPPFGNRMTHPIRSRFPKSRSACGHCSGWAGPSAARGEAEMAETLRLKPGALEWREIDGEVVVLDTRASKYLAVRGALA